MLRDVCKTAEELSSPGLRVPEVSRLEYFIERVILCILNHCVVFSDVSGTSTTRRDRPWLRMNWRSQEVASLKLRGPRDQATNFLVACSQHNNIGGDSRVK